MLLSTAALIWNILPPPLKCIPTRTIFIGMRRIIYVVYPYGKRAILRSQVNYDQILP